MVSAIGVLFALTFVVWHVTLQDAIDDEFKSIRAKGEPLTFDDVLALHPEVEGENLADALQNAFGHVVEETDPARDAKLPLLGGLTWQVGDPISESSLPIVADHLKKNATAIELMHKASTIQRGKYPIHNRGVHTLLPHLGELRKTVELLVLDACYAAEQGDTDRAVDSLLAALAIGRSVKHEPFLITQIVRVACNYRALAAIRAIVGARRLTETQLGRLAKAIEWSGYGDACYRALLCERAAGIAHFEDPKSLAMVLAGPSEHELAVHRFAGTFKLDRLTYLEFMRQYIDAAHLPDTERDAAFKRIDLEFDTMRASRIGKLTRPLTSELMPALGTASKQELKGRAHWEVTRAGVAVERYRLAEGRTPGALADAVPKYLPAAPVDPFGGKPLEYKLTVDGFAVYSVGENGADDGGSGDDIVFSIRR